MAACHSWPHTYTAAAPGTRRCARGVLQYGLLAIVLALLLLWLGAEYEQFQVRSAAPTTDLYQQSEICGISSSGGGGGEIEIETFASVADFHAADPHYYYRGESDDNEDGSNSGNSNSNGIVAHCGACGSCSNPGDVRIYDATRNTLFRDTAHCAKRALLFGRRTAAKCMAESVGFTPNCGDCWVENIMCDLRHCIFSCLWYGLFSQVDGGHDDDDDDGDDRNNSTSIPTDAGSSGGSSTQLNPCTLCDEMRCGREFVNCAGANRRRSGILSDIERDAETEVCRTVTDHWWDDAALQSRWRAQQQQQEQQREHGSNDDESSLVSAATAAPSSPPQALRSNSNNNNNNPTTAAPTAATELLEEDGGLRRARK